MSPLPVQLAGETPTGGELTALSVRQLWVSLAGSNILQGVDFTVPRGGVTALLGRNGVGKTTTLRAILGLVPSRGEVSLFGTSLSGLPTHRIVGQGIGYVPEDRDVFGRLSVAENLRLAETGEGEPRYEEVFKLFPELAERCKQRAGTLSGGQQQMLSIGRALLYKRRLLIVDEPTKGLAPRIVGDLVAVLEQAAKESTVLLVEQNVAVVRRLADHFVVLDHGQVVHAGEAADLADSGLIRRYLGVSDL